MSGNRLNLDLLNSLIERISTDSDSDTQLNTVNSNDGVNEILPPPPYRETNDPESEGTISEVDDTTDGLDGFPFPKRVPSGFTHILDTPSQAECIATLDERCLGYLDVNKGFEIEAAKERERANQGPNIRLGLVRLRNIGNTCFMNSILQCLSNTQPLLKYILIDKEYEQDVRDANSQSQMKGTLMTEFATLINELWSPSRPSFVDPTSLKSQIQRFNTTFQGAREHDAQEFLRFFLEGLHNDVSRVVEKPTIHLVLETNKAAFHQSPSQIAWINYRLFENSKIADIFVGQLKSTLTCLTCGKRTITFDPFWDLSLSIPSVKASDNQDRLKLEQCLSLFTQEETLDGSEKPYCTRCKTKRKCTKKLTIQRYPEVLVIHLKRFAQNYTEKLRTSIKFPLFGLDMNQFGEKEDVTYNLYAVSNHFGKGLDSGHYLAYVKHTYSGDWYCFDDSRVSRIEPDNLEALEGYILFYEIDPACNNVLRKYRM